MLIDAWFPFVGGGQVHVANLIKSLEANYPIKITLFHSPHHNIIIRSLWCLWVITQLLLAARYQRFNLIHAHAFAPGIPGKILALLLRLPIVFTVHGSHLMDTGAKGIKAWLEKFLLTKIKYTWQISVSRSFTRYPNVNRQLSIINNGVNIDDFDRVKVKPSSQFTFLFVGRNHPTKGISVLIQAFNQVRQQYPEVKLQLVTGGLITGTNLIQQYKHAHAFILPSLVEGQPIVLLEAWAAKLPVIVTKIPGIIETVTEGKDSLVASPNDSKALAQAMVELYLMPKARRLKLGKNGYTKVKKQYAWSAIATATYKVYLQALSLP